MYTRRRAPTLAFVVLLAYATRSACESYYADAPPEPVTPTRSDQQREPIVETGKVPAERRQAERATRDRASATDDHQRQRTLNLSVPHGVLESVARQEDATTRVEDNPPSLFAGDTEEQSVKVRGRLWLDKEKGPSLNSVDGGQIIIEVSTD